MKIDSSFADMYYVSAVVKGNFHLRRAFKCDSGRVNAVPAFGREFAFI